eukprot:gnl/Chilomastix_cuspidata/4260.p1 GENE.gnl/Chilomastix_cuspidata/4260~~gnl/Chilomastix_cuspidata/4260.p1  ORF type:complete len:116 (-),score=22.70 gnl/Chilomastix_cuspidata/4260:13-360(-)
MIPKKGTLHMEDPLARAGAEADFTEENLRSQLHVAQREEKLARKALELRKLEHEILKQALRDQEELSKSVHKELNQPLSTKPGTEAITSSARLSNKYHHVLSVLEQYGTPPPTRE